MFESSGRIVNQLRYISCSWSNGTILVRCQFFINWSKDPVQYQKQKQQQQKNTSASCFVVTNKIKHWVA